MADTFLEFVYYR